MRATIVVRTESEPSHFIAAVRKEISALDPHQTVDQAQTMEEVLLRSFAPQRFNMVLIGVLAGIALVLAAGGIYAESLGGARKAFFQPQASRWLRAAATVPRSDSPDDC